MIEKLLFADHELDHINDCRNDDLLIGTLLDPPHTTNQTEHVVFRNGCFSVGQGHYLKTLVHADILETFDSYRLKDTNVPVRNWRNVVVDCNSCVIRLATFEEIVPFILHHELSTEPTLITRFGAPVVTLGPEIPWELRLSIAETVVKELNEKRETF